MPERGYGGFIAVTANRAAYRNSPRKHTGGRDNFFFGEDVSVRRNYIRVKMVSAVTIIVCVTLIGAGRKMYFLFHSVPDGRNEIRVV